MLLPRILSAIVMALLFIYAVFGLDSLGFQIAIGGVVLLAAWEWARLSGITRQQGRIAFAGLVGTLCYGVALFQGHQSLLLIAPVLWLVALLWVVCYPDQKGWQFLPVRVLFGLLALVITWSAMALLRGSHDFITWVLLLMGLIWGADSGAFFAGKAFGKRKLAAKVSPGKSWEGVLGGVLLTQVGVAVFALSRDVAFLSWLSLCIIALITVLVSVLGDLTESLFKRNESLKDSSRLIPGHGGVMDRLDSLTSAAPIYVLLLSVTGWI